MTNETDIDRLLAQAAAPERARHIDPEFVQRIEARLDARPQASLLRILRFLPAFAAVFAAVLVAPALLGDALNAAEWSLGGVWGWLSEPLGLQLVIEAAKGLGSQVSVGGGTAALWPYAVGVAAVLAPFWTSASDI